MNIKGVLHNMSGWSQFFFFCFLSFAGYTLAIFILLLTLDVQEIGQSATSTRMAMAIQSICLFLIPSIAFAYLCQEKPIVYFKTVSLQNNYIIAILSVTLIAVIQPFIYSVSYYNQQLVLPESMSSIENWMRQAELGAEKSLSLLFTNKSIATLAFNLLVLSIIAGLTEELFFRGCLQQIAQKIFINTHAAVWITAFIFSAIHFQFYGFIPRLLLGAILGYLFVWSKNIWIPIIAHIAHNAINVVLTFLFIGKPEYDIMENYSFGQNILFILPSFVLSLVLLRIIYRNNKNRTYKS